MASRQDDLARVPNDDTGSRISSVPLLGEGFSENANITVTSGSLEGEQETTESPEVDSKTGKRRFWNLGKKKDDEKAKKKKEAALATVSAAVASPAPAPAIRPVSPLHSPRMAHVSYPHYPTSHPYAAPASPGRNAHTSSHVSSPASSQIFERNVQEDGLCSSASPSIPAHITTENHIPPVLDASSVAITDDHLDPDNVEIVMHSAHQPAALTVTGAGTSEVTGTTWHEDLIAHPDNDDAASNYGALDSTDVRRLSFISFADVVHAEHAEHNADHTNNNNRDSLHLSGITGHPALGFANRSPSPIRSATSSHGRGPSPPLSGSASFQGMETSSNYGGRGPGSPFSAHSPPTGAELTIETMRQALRKTGSGDLGGARSQPMSAVGGEEGTAEHHPFK